MLCDVSETAHGLVPQQMSTRTYESSPASTLGRLPAIVTCRHDEQSCGMTQQLDAQGDAPQRGGAAAGAVAALHDAEATLVRLRKIRNTLIGSTNRKVALVATQPLTECVWDLLCSLCKRRC